MAKANDRTIGIMIARAPVPAIHARIGAQLYHSKWQSGTWKRMSVPSGAYKGIDIFCQLLRARTERDEEEQVK